MLKNILFFLLLICQIAVFGQENALLWKLEKDNYPTSYLFGTIHRNDSVIIDFVQDFLPYVDECDIFASEILMDDASMLKVMPYLIEKDTSKQIQHLYTDEEYAYIEKYFTDLLGKEMQLIIPYMSPYIASFLIYPSEETIENRPFVDLLFHDRAAENGLLLIGLESIESQMQYIINIDILDQKNHLWSLLQDEALIKETLVDITELYTNQDLDGLLAYIQLEAKEDPLITDTFLNERNLIQFENALSAMEESAIFIAVGAAHLPGEKGLIELFKQEGFQVSAVIID